MSIDVMSSVWKHSQHRGTALLLLLALADSANDYGECYPGIAYLAKKCRMKERNLQVLLKELEKSDELIIKRQEGQDTPTGKTNLYMVVTPGALEKQGVQRNAPLSQGVQNSVSRGAKSGSQGVQRDAPKPSVNPINHNDDVRPRVADKGGLSVDPRDAALEALHWRGERMSADQRRRILQAQPDLTIDQINAWGSWLADPPAWSKKPLGKCIRNLVNGDPIPVEHTNGRTLDTGSMSSVELQALFNGGYDR
jgi:hypothetical protein